MMANLFSTFDPSTNTFSLNWLSSPLMLILLPPMFWFIPSRLNLIWFKIVTYLHKEFKILMKQNKSNGSTIIFTTLFTLIMLNNFMGLFPYIFTSSSHAIFTLSLSLPMWMSFMLYGWTKNSIHMFAHLVPQGAPNALLPFLVVIETISNMIRPGTLAVRLTANMMAGHLLITLLSMTGPMMKTNLISLLIISQVLLLILESAVSIIQAYVFSILLTLYSSEV